MAVTLLQSVVLWSWLIWIADLNVYAQQIILEDVTAESGIRFEHHSGRTGKHFLVETVSCGMATFDYDDDGLIDIYLLSGGPLLSAKVEPPPVNRLFKNLGGFRFRDVTRQAGIGDPGFALGVVAGDYDNDGDPDIFLTNFGPAVLLENNGDGTFDRREFPSLAVKPKVGAGAALLDFDNDGSLDFYAAKYVDFDFETNSTRKIYGVPAAPGPLYYAADSDSLYRNDGQGGFVDVSVESGIASVAGPGMGVIAFDYDQDLDTDIFVCNDSAANFLFENLGNGQFIENALLAGVAYDVTGARQASMGVDIGDIDHDGHLDLITTNFVDEVPTLYRNSGLGYFDDIGAASGLGRANRSVTWGVGFVDFDNDSWQDCFICAGHLIQGVSKLNDADIFQAPNVVLRNVGGRFTTDGVGGSAMESVEVSRGSGFDDLDNDGRIDAVVLNLDSPPQIIRNASRRSGHYIQLRLVGRESNREGAGARVEVLCENQRFVREAVLGRGYQSHFGQRLHVGLASATSVDQIVVHWNSGRRDVLENLAVDRAYVIVEGAQQAVAIRH